MSRNQDTFEILLLPVVEKETGIHIRTLDKALETFFDNEEVDMKCNDCGSTVFTKQISITKLPLVLIMQYVCYSNEGEKLKLSITANTLLKIQNIEYNLTGVLVHVGETRNSGHYFTITLCVKTNCAYKLDDNKQPSIIPAKLLKEYIKKGLHIRVL